MNCVMCHRPGLVIELKECPRDKNNELYESNEVFMAVSGKCTHCGAQHEHQFSSWNFMVQNRDKLTKFEKVVDDVFEKILG